MKLNVKIGAQVVLLSGVQVIFPVWQSSKMLMINVLKDKTGTNFSTSKYINFYSVKNIMQN